MLRIEGLAQSPTDRTRTPTALYYAQSIGDLKASRNQPLREAQQAYQEYLESMGLWARKLSQLRNMAVQGRLTDLAPYPTRVTSLVFLPNVKHTAETHPSPDNGLMIYDRDPLEVEFPSLRESALHIFHHPSQDELAGITIGNLVLSDNIRYIDLLHQPQAQTALRRTTWPWTGVLLKSEYRADNTEGRHVLYRVYGKLSGDQTARIARLLGKQPRFSPGPATSAA